MSSSFQLSGPVFLAGFMLGGLAWAAPAEVRAAPGADVPVIVPAPATQPANAVDGAANVDPAVQALIDQLGHPDADVREGATLKLRAMGKAVLPALKPLADADDPEVKARARALIRQAERRLPPAAPRAGGWGRADAVSIRKARDRTIIEVDENGRKIHITKRGDGAIDMSVTGLDPSGKEATETYQARDAEELKRDNPEAYALYEQWHEGGSRLHVMRDLVPGAHGIGEVAPERLLDEVRRQVRRDLERVRVPREQIDGLVEQLRGIDRAAGEAFEQRRKEMDRLIGPARDDIDKLREQLLRPRDEEGKPLKPEGDAARAGDKQDAKARVFDELDRARGELRRVLEQDREQIARLNEELRRQLEEMAGLGLVGPLRPGPRPVLGVRVGELGNNGGSEVTVMDVLPGSRAARIGMREGDVVRRLNGKDVKGVMDLVDRVGEVLGGEKPEPVVVEVERDGKPLKLEEKPAPTTKPAA